MRTSTNETNQAGLGTLLIMWGVVALLVLAGVGPSPADLYLACGG